MTNDFLRFMLHRHNKSNNNNQYYYQYYEGLHLCAQHQCKNHFTYYLYWKGREQTRH